MRLYVISAVSKTYKEFSLALKGNHKVKKQNTLRFKTQSLKSLIKLNTHSSIYQRDPCTREVYDCMIYKSLFFKELILTKENISTAAVISGKTIINVCQVSGKECRTTSV